MNVLYLKKGVGSMNTIHYKSFMERVAGKRSVKPEQLPPTLDASNQHFYRVYFQIQFWLGNCDLNPILWGWKLVDKQQVISGDNVRISWA